MNKLDETILIDHAGVGFKLAWSIELIKQIVMYGEFVLWTYVLHRYLRVHDQLVIKNLKTKLAYYY